MKRINKAPSILWTKDLDKPEDKEEFLQSLTLSYPVLLRLKEILQDKQTAIRSKTESTQTFLSPSWSHRQASSLGELRNIQFIIDLLGV